MSRRPGRLNKRDETAGLLTGTKLFAVVVAAISNDLERYVAAEDIYRCPAGERLTYRFTNQEDGKMLRRYWTNACQSCALKARCTTGPQRRISRWEHEAVLERVQQRLDQAPNKMTLRHQTAEHPFGTIKAWMGATHFLIRRQHKVATKIALNVLAYNMKRVIAILGCRTLLEATQT